MIQYIIIDKLYNDDKKYENYYQNTTTAIPSRQKLDIKKFKLNFNIV